MLDSDQPERTEAGTGDTPDTPAVTSPSVPVVTRRTRKAPAKKAPAKKAVKRSERATPTTLGSRPTSHVAGHFRRGNVVGHGKF